MPDLNRSGFLCEKALDNIEIMFYYITNLEHLF